MLPMSGLGRGPARTQPPAMTSNSELDPEQARYPQRLQEVESARRPAAALRPTAKMTDAIPGCRESAGCFFGFMENGRSSLRM